MPRSRRSPHSHEWALALAATLVVYACAPARPVVVISPGLHPRLTPAAVEQLARAAIDDMDITAPGSHRPPDVLTLTAIPGGPTLSGYLDGVSWIVEARGAFVERLGFWGDTTLRPVGGVRFLISDDDESVISFVFTN